MSRRFQGGQSSERLSLTTVKNNDYLQVYHDAGGSEDSDKGLPFGVVQAQPVATCSTAAGTVAKIANIVASVSQPDFTLLNGRIVTITMTNSNTATDPTLNVNSTGAFPIRLPNQASSVHVGSGCWGAGVWLQFQYVTDGSNQYWLLLGHDVASVTSDYTQYADGRIEYNQTFINNNFRLKTQSSTDLVQYSNGVTDLDILNPQDTQRNGYILMVMGNTSSGDYTYTKLYHIRVGFNGNYHQESLISELLGTGTNGVYFNFTIVNGKLRITCTIGGTQLAFRYKLI